MRKLVPTVVMFGAVIATGTACTVSGGVYKYVDKATVEKEVRTELAAKVGHPIKGLTCPDNLKARVGETMQCTLTDDDGSTLPVALKVTKAEGADVNWSIKVGTKPAPAAS